MKPNYLKEILNNANISQTSMAEQIGQSRINFNKIVNGTRKLDVKTAKKIADIVGKTWFELFEPTDVIAEVNGYIHPFVSDIITINDPLSIKNKKVVLKNYLNDVDNLICIHDAQDHCMMIMEKHRQMDGKTFTEGQNNSAKTSGLYFVKTKSGKYTFIRLSLGKISKWWEIGKRFDDSKIEFVIPVSRIDFNYTWHNMTPNEIEEMVASYQIKK